MRVVPDPAVEVKRVHPFQATKVYVCPGCNQHIAPATGHLVIVPLVEAGGFPYQDVAYRALPLLRSLAAGPLARSRAHVVVYRARWREADVVAAASLRRYVRRLAFERRVAAGIERSSLLRKMLAPLH